MSGKGDPPKSILKKSVKINLGEHTREENAAESRDLSQKSLSGNIRERIVSSWYQASEKLFLSLIITLNELFIQPTLGQIQKLPSIKPICTPSALPWCVHNNWRHRHGFPTGQYSFNFSYWELQLRFFVIRASISWSGAMRQWMTSPLELSHSSPSGSLAL